MQSASRLLVLGVLLTGASPIAVAKLRAQAAAGPVCDGPELRAHVADSRRAAIADDRISLVPPEGLSAVTDTSLERTPYPPLILTNTDRTARIWLRFLTGPRLLDVNGARAWLSSMEGRATEIYSGMVWIAREAVAVDETRWGIRLELTGRREGVDEHVWIWSTSFETMTLIASFAAPAGEPRWTEAMARSLATLEVRDCTLRWPLATFVDSAALVRAVAELPAPSDLPAGVRPLFRVMFDSTGPGVKVSRMFDQIPESYAGPVEAAIRAHLKPRPPFLPRFRIFTLRVAAGPQPLVDNPEIVEHRPALRPGERTRLEREMYRLPRPPPDSLRARGGRLHYVVRLRVQVDGRVDPTSVSLERSPGFPQLDAHVLRLVRTLRFTPSTIDGVSVARMVELPIEMGPSR